MSTGRLVALTKGHVFKHLDYKAVIVQLLSKATFMLKCSMLKYIPLYQASEFALRQISY